MDHPFPSLLLTPSPSPESSSRGPSPAPPPPPTTTASVALKRRRQLFDIHSTSPEWTASDQTLLRARLERAGTNQGAVLLRRGQPARVLTGEERERLRREMEEEQRSDGSSAVGSWVTEDGLVAPSSEGSPPFTVRRRGIGGALDRADGQRRKGSKASEGKGMYEHIEYVVGGVDQGAGAEVLLPPRPTTTHTTSLSLGLGPPTPASSLDAAFPFALPSKHNAPPSPPHKSIRIEGFALAAEVDTGPTPPPSSSWSLPKPPPPTPASFSVIASLLTGSRPATPSPSSESQHNSVEAPQFGASVAETPASSGDNAGLAASTVSEGTSVQPAARRNGNLASRPTASPRQLNAPTKSSTLPASSQSSSHGSYTPRRPSTRRATTSSASPPAALGVTDSSLSLSFARRPTMTRQGSMGESFGKLYEGEKAAKRERAMRMLEVRERGGLAAMGMGRERRGSRSPRSVGEVEVLEFEGDESASEGSEVDSEVEVVCDAFETSVFASARSNSATSLSSASSLRCTSPTSSIFPHPHRNRSPRSYSSSSTSGSSPPLLSRTTAPFRPTFPRTPSTSPSVSRRASFTRHEAAPSSRAHTSSDPGLSPLAVAGLGIEPAREEEREDRVRIQRMVRESRRAEEVRRREEAMGVVAGGGGAGRKDSGMGGAMRRLFGLGA